MISTSDNQDYVAPKGRRGSKGDSAHALVTLVEAGSTEYLYIPIRVPQDITPGASDTVLIAGKYCRRY